MKALAVTSPQRTPSLPDVPTFAELGYPDFNVSQWYGLFAPPGTPPEIVDRHPERSVERRSRRRRSSRVSIRWATRRSAASRSEFKKILEDEYARWSLVIRESGLDLQ